MFGRPRGLSKPSLVGKLGGPRGLNKPSLDHQYSTSEENQENQKKIQKRSWEKGDELPIILAPAGGSGLARVRGHAKSFL